VLIKLTRIGNLQRTLDSLPCAEGVRYRAYIDNGGYCIVLEAKYEALVAGGTPHPKVKKIFGDKAPEGDFSKNMYVGIEAYGPFYTFKAAAAEVEYIRALLQQNKSQALVERYRPEANKPRTEVEFATKKEKYTTEPAVEQVIDKGLEDLWNFVQNGVTSVIESAEGGKLTREQVQKKGELVTGILMLGTARIDLKHTRDLTENVISLVTKAEKWVDTVILEGENNKEYAQTAGTAAMIQIGFLNKTIIELNEKGHNILRESNPDWLPFITRITKLL